MITISLSWYVILLIVLILIVLGVIGYSITSYKLFKNILIDLSKDFPNYYLDEAINRITEVLTSKIDSPQGTIIEWKVYCLIGLNENYIDKLAEVCENCQFEMVNAIHDIEEQSINITFIKL